MVIKVQCPTCAKVHPVKERWAGKKGGCPDCGAVIHVPLAANRPAAMPRKPKQPPPVEEDVLGDEAAPEPVQSAMEEEQVEGIEGAVEGDEEPAPENETGRKPSLFSRLFRWRRKSQ